MKKYINIKKPRALLIINDHGMASFFVALTMAIVLTLIVMGFAMVSIKSQASTLDRQLSVQAFYAAESGVNTAINDINNFVNSNSTSTTVVSPPDNTSCATPNGIYSNLSPGVVNSQSSNVRYTCVLVNTQPNSLFYTATTSKVINIQYSNSASSASKVSYISSITINWVNSSSSTANFSGCGKVGSFPDSWPSAKCTADVLQIDLVPANALTSENPQTALEADTSILFLYPTTNPTNPVDIRTDNLSNQTDNQNGEIFPAYCTSVCSETINFNPADSQYFMRLSAMYGIPQTITITGVNGAGNQVSFIDGQAVIDSTGQAQNVLRRIEVRTSLNTLNNGLFPKYALQTTNTICKRFYITPPDNSSGFMGNPTPGAANYDPVATTNTSACSLQPSS